MTEHKNENDKGKVVALQQEAEAYQKAIRSMGDTAVELWSSRISAALKAEDPERLKEILSNPTPTPMYLDKNGNCPCTPKKK
jgi:hypothetical protein